MTFRSKQPGYYCKYTKLYRSGYRVNVDATVTVRMIQALQAIGYSNGFISEESGVGDGRYISALSHGKRKWVRSETAKSIAKVYAKYHHRPLDDEHAKKVIGYARKRRLAAPACWDDITDLEATPMGVLRK